MIGILQRFNCLELPERDTDEEWMGGLLAHQDQDIDVILVIAVGWLWEEDGLAGVHYELLELAKEIEAGGGEGGEHE